MKNLYLATCKICGAEHKAYPLPLRSAANAAAIEDGWTADAQATTSLPPTDVICPDCHRPDLALPDPWQACLAWPLSRTAPRVQSISDGPEQLAQCTFEMPGVFVFEAGALARILAVPIYEAALRHALAAIESPAFLVPDVAAMLRKALAAGVYEPRKENPA